MASLFSAVRGPAFGAALVLGLSLGGLSLAHGQNVTTQSLALLSGRPAAWTKDLTPAPTKGAAVGKIKECCGYPLGPPRGFKMTFYWIAWEAEYANEPYDTDVYTRDGFFLGRFPRTFIYELRLEGSGILRDGRVINYDGACSYGVGTCFKQVDPREHPLGMGGQRRPLQPYRSVAVDPRYIPIGTPLYLPELAGVLLPDGSRHDGCVRADDTGGGIQRKELDFFVQSYAQYKTIADNMWWDAGVTPLVEEPRCAYLRRGDPSTERGNEHTDWLALHQPAPRLTQGRKPPPGKSAAPGRKAGQKALAGKSPAKRAGKQALAAVVRKRK